MRAEELAGKLSGIFAPICTPFADNEDVDFGALAHNMGLYSQSGLLGYLTLGSNGENRSLTDGERLQVLGEVVKLKGRGQVVLACATYDAQRDTERFLSAAGDLGADFGLVLSPGYFRKEMTEDTLFRYFWGVADKAPMPILIYNAPQFCGVTVTPGLIQRLSSHPNIVGMKDSASSGIESFLEFESPSFHVMAGSANFLFKAMLGGSLGGNVSLANYLPELAVELFRCGADRDEQKGAPLSERVSRINQAVSGVYGVPGVKAAMSLTGFTGGVPRRPLLALDADHLGRLREMMTEEGLIK
jgi:4-hydroxy-2-oxoglutarate aldolase